jgi:hypothetical protein
MSSELVYLFSQQDKDDLFYRNFKNSLYISASEFGQLLGVDKFISRKKFLEWKYKGKPKGKVFKPACDYGKKEEAGSLDRLSKITGFVIIRVGGMKLSEDQRIGCSPDGLFFNNETNEWEGVEAKNPFSKILPFEFPDISHILQCIVCLEVFKVNVWNLFYNCSTSREFVWYKIKRSKEAFEFIYKEFVIPFFQGTLRETLIRGEKSKIIEKNNSMVKIKKIKELKKELI